MSFQGSWRLHLRGPVVEEAIDAVDLIQAEVRPTQVALHLVELIDDFCQVLESKVLRGVRRQHLVLVIVEKLLRLEILRGLAPSYRLKPLAVDAAAVDR